jgi:hypothetical protein
MQCLQSPPVVRSLAIFAAISILSGCAAVHTSIAKKDLDVQTKMSDTVFLDPVGPDKKTVFGSPGIPVVGPICDEVRYGRRVGSHASRA